MTEDLQQRDVPFGASPTARSIDRPGNLCALNFVDIYLTRNPNQVTLGGIPGTGDPIPAPIDCYDELSVMYEECLHKAYGERNPEEEEPLNRGFSLRVRAVSYRCTVIETIEEVAFVLRRSPKTIPTMEELGIPRSYGEHFLEPNLRGLVVIAGGMRQGKTYTAGSVAKARLSRYGGTLLGAEDPPELPLHGVHGEAKGQAWQTWVRNGDFATSCREFARTAASIIYIGEIRDHAAALETIRAAQTGALVITTTHAIDIPTAIRRLVSLAGSALRNEEEAASMLSQVVSIVAHQELSEEIANSNTKLLKMKFLYANGEDSTSIRSLISERSYGQLGDVIQRQLSNNLITRRK